MLQHWILQATSPAAGTQSELKATHVCVNADERGSQVRAGACKPEAETHAPAALVAAACPHQSAAGMAGASAAWLPS